jgi:hypothetical protein
MIEISIPGVNGTRRRGGIRILPKALKEFIRFKSRHIACDTGGNPKIEFHANSEFKTDC